MTEAPITGPRLARDGWEFLAALEALSAEQREDFERVSLGSAWPEVGSRMMTRAITGQDCDNGWVVVQETGYRYAVVQNGGLLVRSVLAEYLATEVRWPEE